VGIEGQLVHGRQTAREFFTQLVNTGVGTQTIVIEPIRFLVSDLAVVEGSSTITGARDANGKVLPTIHGRGCENRAKEATPLALRRHTSEGGLDASIILAAATRTSDVAF